MNNTQNTTGLCQSCGMPLTDPASLATNADGSQNTDYCIYCFKDGKFTADCTMNEMIEQCIPFMLQAMPELSSEQAANMLNEVLPGLKRWK